MGNRFVLLIGATITGVLGCCTVLFIRSNSRIEDDAAMGIVLSVFFGAGCVVLGFVQTMPEGVRQAFESLFMAKLRPWFCAIFSS